MGLLGKTLAFATTVESGKVKRTNVREKVVTLSKEEYQQKLLAEEAKLKHLTDALRDEKELQIRNQQKIAINWRRILSMIKSEDFKKELEMHSFLFQREVDSKDSMIQSLDSRLEDSLEQYQSALRSHYIHLDKYNSLLEDKVQNLEQSFQESLQSLRQEFASEHETICQMHHNQVG